ncbi:hypothetical protein [Ferrimonas marina]|uniref:Four helix bundle sensory module for signal transduction n=1 Tax=Ferrimonas marina TaxID=299255 RepID=A0A1M5RZV4_9GAMM|nr:hypothetical protein [Ferrimonas marina]SHH31892.1 hypothetical protein SAMN02745129_1822 [Ferrimonas marina]
MYETISTLPQTVYIGIGTVIAAFVAGLISVVNTTISKENKISEFRQAWSEAIIDEVSTYISLVSKIHVSWLTSRSKGISGATFLESEVNTIREMQALQHKITLRLHEEKHAKIIEHLKRIDLIICNNNIEQKEADLEHLIESLSSDTKTTIKQEWIKVKLGEIHFIWLRRIGYFLSVSLASLIFSTCLLYIYFMIKQG